MKKIMKKALSLILVLALAIVPMTVMAAEGETLEEASYLATLEGTVSVEASKTVYYYYSGNPMTSPSQYMLDVEGTTGFALGAYAMGSQTGSVTDANGKATIIVNTGMGMPAYYFAITNNTGTAQSYTYKLYEPVGSYNNPADIELGKITATTSGGYGGYYYDYAVPADGSFTVSMDTAASSYGWMYSILINDIPYETEPYRTTYYSDDSDVADISTLTVTVEKDDNVIVNVNTYNPTNMYDQNPVGNVVFGAYFEADVKADSNANDGNGYASLEVGTNDVVQNGTVNTTIYVFEPAETGTYKISAADGMVVSTYNGTSFNVGAVDQAPAASVEVTCTSVGQEFMIGVASSSTWVPTTQVTIEKTADYVPPVEVQWTIYKNQTTPKAFEYKGGEVEYVNIEDATVDKAVLGTDGYYHLNSADGKILYVDLNDTALISLKDAADYYGLKVIKTEDGEVTEKISYNEALLEYYACADAKTGLYPLTKDLMDMLQAVGENQGWYGENGQVQVKTADAWMFACYYEKTATPVKPAPATGDSTNMMVWAIVMVVAAGAAVVAFESKRRAR